MDQARATRRRSAAIGVLVMAVAAIVATSPAPYEPDVTATHAERVTLTADGLFAAGTLVIEASAGAAAAAAAGQNESQILLTATVEDTDATGEPLFRLVSRPVFDDGREFGTDRNDFLLDQLCPTAGPCALPIEVTIEWLNPEPRASVEVVLDAVAGIDIREGGGNGDDVTLAWHQDIELAVADPPATLRAQTEPETVTLSAERPVVVRHVRMTLTGDGVPGDARLEDRHLIVSVPVVDGIEVRIVGGDREAHGRPGVPIEVWCDLLVECERSYTVMLSWLPETHTPEEELEVAWQAVAIARYPDVESVPEGAELTLLRDGGTDLVLDERSVIATLDGSVVRRPADQPGPPPVDGARPDLSAFAVDIGASWTAGDGLADLAVPVLGEMTVQARSESGDRIGSVEISIGLPYTTARYGPPERERLEIGGAPDRFVVLLGDACFARIPCRVPVEIFIHPLDEGIAEPIHVDWSVEVTAFVPEGATLSGDAVTIVPGPFEPDPS